MLINPEHTKSLLIIGYIVSAKLCSVPCLSCYGLEYSREEQL